MWLKTSNTKATCSNARNPSGSCSRTTRQSRRPRRPGVWNSTVRRLLGSWQRLDCPSDCMMILGLSINFCARGFFFCFKRKYAQKQTIARLLGSISMGGRQVQYLRLAEAVPSCKDFVKSLFSRPFVVTIQGQDSLNTHHDARLDPG